jgi:alpha-terpineol hydroxylase
MNTAMNNATTRPPRIPDAIARAVILPESFTDLEGVVYPACRWLHENMPIGIAAVEGYDPVWILSKHAHIKEVMSDPELYHNADVNIFLQPTAGDDYLRGLLGGTTKVLQDLSYMEPPEHLPHRNSIQIPFMPARVNRYEAMLRRLAREAVDRMLDSGGECDFVDTVSRDYPFFAIMEILGIPREGYPAMLKMAQDTFGANDPELKRDDIELTPEAFGKQWLAAVRECYEYVETLRQDRLANPRDDLTSAIVHARLKNGEPLPDRTQNNFISTVVLAGHDTTSSAISGGMLGLIKHPDQLQRAKDDPSLIQSLVEECLRYSTPAKHFMRNSTRATTLHGYSMRAMERVMCLLVAGNRDPDVFPQPERFDVGRKNNPHIAFAWGQHVCLGQFFAKIEMRTLFQELLPRIKSIELAGLPKQKAGNFVTGLKKLPIRVTPA